MKIEKQWRNETMTTNDASFIARLTTKRAHRILSHAGVLDLDVTDAIDCLQDQSIGGDGETFRTRERAMALVGAGIFGKEATP